MARVTCPEVRTPTWLGPSVPHWILVCRRALHRTFPSSLKFLMGSSALGSLQVLSLKTLWRFRNLQIPYLFILCPADPRSSFQRSWGCRRPSSLSSQCAFPRHGFAGSRLVQEGIGPEMEELSPCSLQKSKVFPVL